jgi:phage recombination protein Bet
MTGTSLIATMAERYHMEPAQFALTVRKTAMPSNATNEEFAAFMMVAYEYKLNPILRQIYAYPKKGGGITPVVSIDGWAHLVNTHPMFDGMTFDFDKEDGKLVSCTCTIFRKNTSHPTVITEYYAECYRNTEPWNQMPGRMLRHKALKEAARYAFSLSGISDEDEARDIAGSVAQIQKPIVVDAQLDDWAAGDDINTNSGSPSPPPTSQEPEEPVGVGPLTPTGLRQEAIDHMLDYGTLVDVPVEERLETLDNAILTLEDRLPAPFLKQLHNVGARVIKGDLSPKKAREHLEGLR